MGVKNGSLWILVVFIYINIYIYLYIYIDMGWGKGWLTVLRLFPMQMKTFLSNALVEDEWEAFK